MGMLFIKKDKPLKFDLPSLNHLCFCLMDDYNLCQSIPGKSHLKVAAQVATQANIILKTI